MIRFSTRGEYGIRMMMDLAKHYGEGPQALSEVARHEALPATYLEQLVGKLRRAGLVTSSHGARGGYELTRPPRDISVGEVMRVLEGPISPQICATEGETDVLCERQYQCGANLVWERVRDSVAQALDSLTLADLVPPPALRGHVAESIMLHPIEKSVSQERNTARV
jgi:Rrf2 family transcriptional regulator, cysteine metabolism repressor